MISKNTLKLIKSLALKKFRIKEKLFLVEGDKNVTEVLSSGYKTEKLFATGAFLSENAERLKKVAEVTEVESIDIKKASLLQNPQNSLALCSLPDRPIFPASLSVNLSIYLDDIQDPGNLGTIIRICDWFNVEFLFCSPNTADLFNPKVIQASMGSFCRAEIIKTSFEPVHQLAQLSETPIYGAFLDGKNIYTAQLPKQAILVMGNEGRGIGKEIEGRIGKRVKIPGFSTKNNRAESLNVSVATAIICSEFKRNSF